MTNFARKQFNYAQLEPFHSRVESKFSFSAPEKCFPSHWILSEFMIWLDLRMLLISLFSCPQLQFTKSFSGEAFEFTGKISLKMNSRHGNGRNLLFVCLSKPNREDFLWFRPFVVLWSDSLIYLWSDSSVYIPSRLECLTAETTDGKIVAFLLSIAIA